MTETSRRGFLKGLLGLTVVAVLPIPSDIGIPISAKKLDIYDIKAPEGTTYQWVRTALYGDPDPENVRLRLTNGWKFVTPAEQPGAPISELGNAVEKGGLVLMQKPTADVEAYLAEQRKYGTPWVLRHNGVMHAHVDGGPTRVDLSRNVLLPGNVPAADPFDWGYGYNLKDGEDA